MEPCVYFGLSSLRTNAKRLAHRAIIAAQSIFLVVALGGCELSPEQVKFRDPPKGDEVQAPNCARDDCPESAPGRPEQSDR